MTEEAFPGPKPEEWSEPREGEESGKECELNASPGLGH